MPGWLGLIVWIGLAAVVLVLLFALCLGAMASRGSRLEERPEYLEALRRLRDANPHPNDDPDPPAEFRVLASPYDWRIRGDL